MLKKHRQIFWQPDPIKRGSCPCFPMDLRLLWGFVPHGKPQHNHQECLVHHTASLRAWKVSCTASLFLPTRRPKNAAVVRESPEKDKNGYPAKHHKISDRSPKRLILLSCPVNDLQHRAVRAHGMHLGSKNLPRLSPSRHPKPSQAPLCHGPWLSSDKRHP